MSHKNNVNITSGPTTPDYNSIHDIKNRLADTTLIWGAILGALYVFIASLRYLSVGGLSVLIAYFIIYFVLLAAMIIRRHLSFNSRALIIAICTLSVALTSIIKWGLIGTGIPFFIFGSIIITVFWGIRSGMIITVINLTVICLLAILFNMDLLQYDFSLNEFALAMPSWLTVAAGYGFFTAILVFIVGNLFYSMDSTIEKLKIRGVELQAVKEQMEKEINIRKKTEIDLQESEERFRIILEKLPGAVFVHDLNGKNLIVNDEACRVMGYSREELLNRTVEQDEPETFDMDNARKTWQRLVETGESTSFESVTRRKDGLLYNLEVYLKSIVFQGQPVILVVAYDITERKQAENALKESEERFRTVLENLPACVSVHDLEGRHLMVNEQTCMVNGFSREEYLSRTVMDLAGPGFDPEAASKLWHEIEPGSSFTFDILTRRKDGSLYDSEVHLTSIILKGRPVILSLVFDVTERKKAEEALKKSEMYLRTLVNTVPDLIWLKDENGRYLYCNTRFEEFFGANEKDITGKTDYDFVDKKLADFFRENDRNAIEKGGPRINEEEITFASDGHKEMLETIKTPMYRSDETLVGVLGIGRDITERKKIEENLARRSELERLVSEISSGFVNLSHYEIDTYIKEALASIGEKTEVDHAYLLLFQAKDKMDILEWRRDNIVPEMKTIKDYNIEKELPWLSEQIKRRNIIHIPDMDKLPDKAQKEKAHFGKMGIKSYIALTTWHGERPVGLLGFDTVREKKNWSDEEIVIFRIIGETFTSAIQHKRAEEEQEKLQAQLATAVDLAQLGPWELDLERNLFTFNDHFYRIYHTTAEEMGGYTMTPEDYTLRFVHPDDLDLVVEGRERGLANFFSAFGRAEYKMLYADGGVGYATTQVSVSKNSMGTPIKVFGVNQDITEWKIAQERLRENEEKLARSRKMESLGLLAGGVAHDLNNVLSGIVSYPELLLMDLPENSKMRKSIETIQKSGERAVAIVQDLLTIARGAVTIKEPMNINNIIDEYLSSPEFIKLKLHHPTVDIYTNLFHDIFNIRGSLIHIKKVIMNLVSNASEAIEGKGVVTISTKNIYLDKAISRYEEVKPGEYIVFSVSDDGPGIAPNNLERIFEPFFTKKVMGVSGTGLGLTVVWNIVQDHSGYIDVTSNENGTRFDLYFPVTRDNILDKTVPVMLDKIKGKGEKILVIDDVESQREISCRMLDILGYQYKSVASGEEALSYLDKNRVDLILLDMIMEPGISGRETYERIVKIYPKQKAVILSGFSETEDVIAIQKLGAGKYIKKPFTLAELGSAIKEELDKLIIF